MRYAWMLAGLAAISTAWADGPGDNLPTKVRRVPKLGIEVSPEQKQQIEASLAELRRAMEAEGFTVYPAEWWHFDFEGWRRWPILDLTFEELDQ